MDFLLLQHLVDTFREHLQIWARYVRCYMSRVEPKLDLNGRGIATTPESVMALHEEIARRERANAPKPKKPFKKVIREKSENS